MVNDLDDHKTDGLTYKARMFCHEYINEFNGTKSAIAAGYSEKTAYSIASELLKKPEVRAKIQELMDLRAKRCEITSDGVLTELHKLAYRDVSKIFGPNGGLLKPSELDPANAAAIEGIEVVTRPGVDEDGERCVEYVHKYKFADKKGCLESLGKHLKLFTETKDVNVGLQGGLAELLEEISEGGHNDLSDD